MKKLSFLIICFVGSFFSAYAEKTSDDQVILVCPKTVECDSNNISTCSLSDNPYDFWNKPIYNGKLIKGTYRLREVTYSEYKIPVCNYFIHDRQPMPIKVSYDINTPWKRKYNYINYFTPLRTDSSKWNGDSIYNYKCSSDSPSLCPLVEAPEIVTLNTVGLWFYYPINSYSEFGQNFKIFHRLNYEQLQKICGINSSCIIDVGNCDQLGDDCLHLGTVNLDLSTLNIVRVDQVTNDSSNLLCALKKKEPFNTIYCEPKNGAEIF